MITIWNEKLKELRGSVSADKVAEDLGLSPDTYLAFERGERMPKDTVKEMIAEYFGVSAGAIW